MFDCARSNNDFYFTFWQGDSRWRPDHLIDSNDCVEMDYIHCRTSAVIVQDNISFSDAEPAEDSVEQVVRVDRPDHLAELLEGKTQFQRQQLGGLVEQDDVMCVPNVSQSLFHMMSATTQAWGERRGLRFFRLCGQ
jgi:hypothetical protein